MTFDLLQGPTITLRILDYSLMHDVAAAQTTQHGLGQALDHPPLVRPRCHLAAVYQFRYSSRV